MPRSRESTSAHSESSDGSLFGSPHLPERSVDVTRETRQREHKRPREHSPDPLAYLFENELVLRSSQPETDLTLPSTPGSTHDAHTSTTVDPSLSPPTLLLGMQNAAPEARSEGSEGTPHPPAPKRLRLVQRPSRQTQPQTLTLPQHPPESETTLAASFPDGYPLFPQEMRGNVASQNPRYVGNDITRMVRGGALVAPITNNPFTGLQRDLQRPRSTHLPRLAIPRKKLPSRFAKADVTITSPGETQYPSRLTNKGTLHQDFYMQEGVHKHDGTPRDDTDSLYLPPDKSRTRTRRSTLVREGKSGKWTLTYGNLELQKGLPPKRQRRRPRQKKLSARANDTAPQYINNGTGPQQPFYPTAPQYINNGTGPQQPFYPTNNDTAPQYINNGTGPQGPFHPQANYTGPQGPFHPQANYTGPQGPFHPQANYTGPQGPFHPQANYTGPQGPFHPQANYTGPQGPFHPQANYTGPQGPFHPQANYTGPQGPFHPQANYTGPQGPFHPQANYTGPQGPFHPQANYTGPQGPFHPQANYTGPQGPFHPQANYTGPQGPFQPTLYHTAPQYTPNDTATYQPFPPIPNGNVPYPPFPPTPDHTAPYPPFPPTPDHTAR